MCIRDRVLPTTSLLPLPGRFRPRRSTPRSGGSTLRHHRARPPAAEGSARRQWPPRHHHHPPRSTRWCRRWSSFSTTRQAPFLLPSSLRNVLGVVRRRYNASADAREEWWWSVSHALWQDEGEKKEDEEEGEGESPERVRSGASGAASMARLVGCAHVIVRDNPCLLYTSPSPRDATLSRMPSSA